MILGGKPVVRRIGYRGYTLTILNSGQVQISEHHDPDVICTEPSRVDAERVVDGWVANVLDK